MLGGTLSIDWKLPLLITAVLAAGLAAFLAFTYVTLSRRSETLVRDRFAHAAGQVARSIETAVAARADIARRTARAPAVARALEIASSGTPLSTRDSIAAAAALGSALTRDSLAALLVDPTGRVVATAGKPLPPTIRVIDPTSVAPLSSDDSLDKARIGPLTAVDGRVLFWVVAPVVVGGRPTGYFMQPRYVVGPPDAMQNLRELTREDLTLYSRNMDGTGWMVAPGIPAPPPLDRDSKGGRVSYERPDQGRFVAEEAPIAGTSWLVVIDSPVRSLLARLRSTIERLAWMSLIILAAGAVLAWIVGRRITRPLILLTSAADQVATGTYEQPIAVAGRDEIGRLAKRFHEMAAQVTEARRELEQRASDAQDAADKLAAANRRLQTTMTEAESARAEAERARGDAEAANRAKSDFLAMMSHELRTPLNAIGGYAELIELGIHGPVTDAQRNALNRIARSQAHLLTLINDVLNFARVDSGQIQYAVQDVRMHDTLAGLEPLVEPQIAARKLTFQYDACDPTIVAAADADKVRQVVLNLLGNAVKYTPEGGRVTLACEADAKSVRVHVRDTGPGIEPDQLPVIFEAFVQGHRALNRPNEGVGLGLAISRDLARGMGGDVTVQTELGVGSSFTLELPRAGAVRLRVENPLSATRVASAR
jgi:signal transduction histidine kinase